MKKLSLLLALAALPVMAIACQRPNIYDDTSGSAAVNATPAQKPAEKVIETKTHTSSLGFQFDYPANYDIEERGGAVTLLDHEYAGNATEVPYLSISLSDKSVDASAKELHAIKLADGENTPAVTSDTTKQYGPYEGREIVYVLDIGGSATEVLVSTKKGTVHFYSDGENKTLPQIIASFKLTK
jgi:hypothetical protein